MKILSTLVLTFLIAPQAWSSDLSLADWQNASVKVSSFPCLTARPRFSGSGILISYNGELWVLTSEHVVLHDKSSATCHEIQTTSGTATANLISVDYVKGMALLKIVGPKTFQKLAVSIEALDQGATPKTALVALGFPALSDSLQTLTGGNLINSQSRRASIPGLNTLIEAANLPVEYGMSGGALLAQNSNAVIFAGLLSHQILRREAGLPTQTETLEPGASGNPNDLALAISANDALSWFLTQFQKPASAGWQRLESAQLSGAEVIQFGPLLFSLKQENAQDVWNIGGADGTGIGGADGTGIGGPVTVASTTALKSVVEVLNTVEVKLNPTAGPDLRGTPLANAQLEQWRIWLLSGKKVEVVFLRNRQAMRLTRIDSLEQLLTSWLRDGNQPVALRSQSGNEQTDASTVLQLARKATSLTQNILDKLANGDSQKPWFATLRDLTIMAENGMISSQDVLNSLSGANAPCWQQFYEQDFDSAVALEAAIQNLAQQMKKMGL